MPTIPIWWYLTVSAGLFAIGAFGVLVRRNAVAVLMGVELMLNAVNVQTLALWRYVTPPASVDVGGTVGPFVTAVDGQAFALFVIVLAAAEAAVGLALVIAVYRSRRVIALDELTALHG
jgi:NADH-quinone oxidoreductase subunit K